MPGLDRTGPMGEGAKTGRGRGRCNSDKASQETFPGRRGRATGGFRNRWFRTGNSK